MNSFISILMLMSPAVLLSGILAVLSTWRSFRSTARLYWRICAVLLWGGIVCFFVGEMGTTIDSEGVLHELGIALLLSALMLMAGTIGVVIIGIVWTYRFAYARWHAVRKEQG